MTCHPCIAVAALAVLCWQPAYSAAPQAVSTDMLVEPAVEMNCDPAAGLVDGACFAGAALWAPTVDREGAQASTVETFALRSHCGYHGPGGTPLAGACIYGRMPPGSIAHLLGARSSKTCAARAVETIMAGFEAGNDYPVTRLDTKRCGKLAWRLAYLGKAKPHYRRLTGAVVVRDRAVSSRIEQEVRARTASLEGFGRLEHPVELSRKPPKIVRLPNQADDTYIVTFENTSEARDSTHVLYARGRVRFIHAAAREVSAFAVDNRNFVHYRFSCYVGCGWQGEFVFEFFDADYRAVMWEDRDST